MTTLLRLKPWAFGAATPVAADGLTPDRIADLDQKALAALPIPIGNRPCPAGDLFDVRGGGSDDVVLEGDLGRFSHLGDGMSRGRLTIRGPAGPRAGSGMRGGELRISGDAGPYAGEGMRGGRLVIDGNAGDHLAAPLSGRPHGLNRGTILVRGSVGAMAGFRMRRGAIAIAGEAGPGAGTAMLAGSLFLLGGAGPGAGALMQRGTIVAARRCATLPTFRSSGGGVFPWLRLYYDALRALEFGVPSRMDAARYERLVGDLSGGGQGEILMLEDEA
jgi:formylmethanofuran dehydrogenase subunit C